MDYKSYRENRPEWERQMKEVVGPFHAAKLGVDPDKVRPATIEEVEELRNKDSVVVSEIMSLVGVGCGWSVYMGEDDKSVFFDFGVAGPWAAPTILHIEGLPVSRVCQYAVDCLLLCLASEGGLDHITFEDCIAHRDDPHWLDREWDKVCVKNGHPTP